MNPATFAVGAGAGSSALGHLASPLGAPRRALWNAIDSLTGGRTRSSVGDPGMFGMGGDEYGASGGARLPDMNGMESGPLRFAPELGQGRSLPQPLDGSEEKGMAGALPAILGLLAGGGLAMTPFAPLAIPAGLLASGAAQTLGESLSDRFKAPETNELYQRLGGIDSSPGMDFATEMLADPMNLLGLAAYSKAGQLGKAAELGTAARTEGRLGSLAERVGMDANPGFGEVGQQLRGFNSPIGSGSGGGTQPIDRIIADLGALKSPQTAGSLPPSPLLDALSGAGDVGAPDRLGDFRKRLMEMMTGRAPTTPMSTATMTDIPMPYLNPMAVPRTPTSILRPSQKPMGVL